MQPFRTLATGLFLILLAGTAPAEEEGFFGAADLRLGERVHAAFPPGGRDVHRLSIYLVKGTTLNVRLSPDPGASLDPSLALVRAGGGRVDLGGALEARRAGLRIRRFVVPYSGWFALEVAARSGAGGYTLATGGRAARVQTGLVPASSAERTFAFHAFEGSTLGVRLNGRGAARPRITGLVDPLGGRLPVNPVNRGAVSKVGGVRLGETGRHSLEWENQGGAGDVRLRFRVVAPPPRRGVLELGESIGRPRSVVDRGDSEIPARAGYVGSAACGGCHTELFRAWSDTAHNSAVRTWDRPGLSGRRMTNDLNGNGRDDFQDNLSLAANPAFAAYGANAPKLRYVAGDPFPFKVEIGTRTWDVHRTMGGNGLWRQRYLTRIGRSHYTLPVQWNEGHDGTTAGYEAYAPEDWYDESGQPRAAVDAGASYEARCSGCHQTGETLTFDAGEFVTGHVEVNIGCEQCHGPGQAHAQSGNPALVANPRDLLDGTADGVRRANEVCARCHTRGHSKDGLAGTLVHGEFGYSAALGVQQFGDDPAAFLVETDDVIGRDAATGAFLASHDGAQFREMQQGPHGSNRGYDPTCVDCHDPHARRAEHQLATTTASGARMATRLPDNTLCLSCHATHGPFAGVSESDVAVIGQGTVPDAVRRATVDHMTDVGMGVPLFAYDPGGTGVGRCDTCHMPRTGSLGAPGTDAAGFARGDMHHHGFEAIWPNASNLHGVTNSCSSCHPTGGDDRAAAIIEQWAGRGRDGDATFHADVPRSFQNGTANADNDQGGVRCAGCHTTEGFVAIQVQGRTLGQDEVDAIVADSLQRDMGITCRACHGRSSDGSFLDTDTAQGTQQPLRFPKAELCGRCHNDETVKFGDFRDHGEIVRHPQREMIDGTAGAEVPGASYSDSAHSLSGLFPGNCVDCHYDPRRPDAQHDFAPQLSACARCHSDVTALTGFDRPAAADFDGDGTVEGIQGEVQGLLDALRAALTADPSMTFSGGSFDFGGATDHKLTGATDAQKRAVFNWYSVAHDKSRGVHNAVRAVQLLQRSYRELTGAEVPGAVLR